MTARRYFGTDGVRGVAGRPPMTAEFAFRLGVATGDLLGRNHEAPTVAVGMDTRRSGPMLAHALTAGLTSRGVGVHWLGVMTTPGVSYLTRALGAGAGAVISASHNPFQDNGIKLFNADGEKLSDAAEAEIERLLDTTESLEPVTGAAIGSAQRYRREDGAYLAFLLSHAPYLDGLKVGLDCANGAASEIAPQVFRKIGARLDLINAQPDGVNINVGCGSTHPAPLQARVVEHELDVGVTFDGDADRALLIDRRGRLVNGDHLLAIAAIARGEREVVATLMTNLGVERYLAEKGVALHRTQVGDRYVFAGLRERGLTLGGEQSGHLLFLDKAPTGDGLLTALQTLGALRKSGRTLESWVDAIPIYPQRLFNVEVAEDRKRALMDDDRVRNALAEAEATLADTGRVNLRPSGTEPLLRVMVEAADEATVASVGERLAGAVREAGTD